MLECTFIFKVNAKEGAASHEGLAPQGAYVVKKEKVGEVSTQVTITTSQDRQKARTDAS